MGTRHSLVEGRFDRVSSDRWTMEDAVEDAAVDPRFESFLADATDPTTPDEIQAQIRAGLARQYANPPVAQTERCLRQNLTPERCRALVYWPDEDDASLYPALLADPPQGAPEDHPQFRCQVTYLMSLYLCHSKRWAFAKGFILAGGLRALVGMCAHPNLHLRGQAMETLGALTREELYPWHEPPAAGSSSDAALHARMLELARTPLVPNLVLNYDAPFPGASSLALRTLAFFASYLRLRHCPNNVLRLSDDLLATLRRWSTRDDEHASDDERTLAKTLLDDFGKFSTDEFTDAPTLNGPDAAREAAELAQRQDADVLDAEAGGSNPGGDGDADPDGAVVVADRTVVAGDRSLREPSPGSSSTSALESRGRLDPWDADTGDAHRRRGNDAFARKRWSAAIEHYTRAIDAPVSYTRLFDEAPRRAAYHANRAAAYLARGDSPGGGHGQFDACGHLENHAWTDEGGAEERAAIAAALNAKAALLDCDAALEMSPGHVKAKFRKAQALWRLARVGEARTCAMSALHGAPTEATEAEVRALLESFDGGPWRPTPFESDSFRGGESSGGREKERFEKERFEKGRLEKGRREGDDDVGGGSAAAGVAGGTNNEQTSMGGMADLLASLGASGDGYPDFDAVANFKSAGADEVFAEVDRFAAEMDVGAVRAKGAGETPSTASVAAYGIDALGSTDGDELYDLD